MRVSSNDVRLAARSFTRHPGFTTIAVLSLALAIALNTTMYSVIDAMVSPKTDIQDADRVFRVSVWGDYRHQVDNETRAALFREGSSVYEATTFSSRWNPFGLSVEYGRRYQQTSGTVVAPNYFRMLGVPAIAGRVFIDDDMNAPTQPVVISSRLAETLFPDGVSPIAKIVDVDGSPHPVVGVIHTRSPSDRVDIWTVPPPGTRLLAMPPNIVRLRQGISPQVADQLLHVLSARFAALAGETPKDTWFQLSPINATQFHLRNFHYALIAAVVAVLLIACANLANLQLARGIGRARELAVRISLGAHRGDIIGQLVLESALLSVVGLVLGLVLTFWGVHLLSSRIPPSVGEYIVAPQTSWRVLAFAAVACVVCVVLVGLLPAIRVSRVDPNVLLKAGAGTGATKRSRTQYGMMVVVQIGLSLALLSGAGVVVRMAMFVNSVKTEYDMTPLSEARLRFVATADTAIRSATLSAGIVSLVRALPDVDDAATYFGAGVDTIGVYESGGQLHEIATPMYGYRIVSPSYLRTFQLHIGAGRDFPSGTPPKPEVIVDQQTAHVLWPGLNPVGREIRLGGARSATPWLTVVGVTQPRSDLSRLYSQTVIPEKGARLGAIYYVAGANDSPHFGSKFWSIDMVVRSRTDHERMPITLKRALLHYPGARYITAERMEEALGIRRERQSHDFVAATFISFAALAVCLAALGIYGIVSHSVAERRRELGVRIALGATSRNIMHVVLREGNAVALAGVAVGLVFTRATVGWLAAFSLEDEKYNAPLFASMAVALFAVAVLAALLPGIRATRIDPVESLRSE